MQGECQPGASSLPSRPSAEAASASCDRKRDCEHAVSNRTRYNVPVLKSPTNYSLLRFPHERCAIVSEKTQIRDPFRTFEHLPARAGASPAIGRAHVGASAHDPDQCSPSPCIQRRSSCPCPAPPTTDSPLCTSRDACGRSFPGWRPLGKLPSDPLASDQLAPGGSGPGGTCRGPGRAGLDPLGDHRVAGVIEVDTVPRGVLRLDRAVRCGQRVP